MRFRYKFHQYLKFAFLQRNCEQKSISHISQLQFIEKLKKCCSMESSVFLRQIMEDHQIYKGIQPIQIVTIITDSLAKDGQFQYAFAEAYDKYSIACYKLAGLTPQKVCQAYSHLLNKIYIQKTQFQNLQWLDNELRLFIWLLVGYSYIWKKRIMHMGENQWKLFSRLFNEKNLNLIQFEAYLVSKKASRTKKWGKAEQDLLQNIAKPIQKKRKWKEIAQKLYYSSGRQYLRTPKQCREHWLNHIDPSKMKTPWTPLQDYRLLMSIVNIGKKWAKISKILNCTRTEHMVKNRYKSLIKNHHKKMKRGNKHGSNEQKIVENILKMLKQQINFPNLFESEKPSPLLKFTKNDLQIDERSIQKDQDSQSEYSSSQKIQDKMQSERAPKLHYQNHKFIQKFQQQCELFLQSNFSCCFTQKNQLFQILGEDSNGEPF